MAGKRDGVVVATETEMAAMHWRMNTRSTITSETSTNTRRTINHNHTSYMRWPKTATPATLGWAKTSEGWPK